MVVIVIALNVIMRPVVKRIDLTKDKLYTLSEGTRRILGRIDTPVQIRFYFSQSDPATPVEYKTYAARVEDLLNEYKLHAKGNLEIKRLDPVPDSDAEDSANVDGVEGQPLSPLGGDKIYFGLAMSCLDARAAIPFLNPSRERLLEYDLTRAIAQVIKPSKPVVGVMSGLPVFGEFNPMMMRMGGGRQEPWLFINELKADFSVKEIQLAADKIDDDVRVLLVIYPKGISDVTQYAIDQFVLRGGKLVAFLDPLSIMDTRSMNPQNPLQGAANSGASLDLLLKAWGLSFDINKVVADKEYFTEMGGEGGRPQVNPSVLQLPAKAVDTNDVVTSQISRLFLRHFRRLARRRPEADGVAALQRQRRSDRKDARAVWRRRPGLQSLGKRISSRRAADRQVQNGLPRRQTRRKIGEERRKERRRRKEERSEDGRFSEGVEGRRGRRAGRRCGHAARTVLCAGDEPRRAAGDGPAVQPEPSFSPEPGRIAEWRQRPDQYAQPGHHEPAVHQSARVAGEGGRAFCQQNQGA